MRPISINFGNFKAYAGEKNITVMKPDGTTIAKITVEKIIKKIFFSFEENPINYINKIITSHNIEKVFINMLNIKCSQYESEIMIKHIYIEICKQSNIKKFAFISKEKNGSLFVNMKKGKLFIKKGKSWMFREKTENGETFKVNDCLKIEQILFELRTAVDKYKIYF